MDALTISEIHDGGPRFPDFHDRSEWVAYGLTFIAHIDGYDLYRVERYPDLGYYAVGENVTVHNVAQPTTHPSGLYWWPDVKRSGAVKDFLEAYHKLTLS